MLVVTAGSHHKTYAKTIKFCEARCKEFGYKFKAYDLGGLGFGTPVEDARLASRHRTLRYAIKPELILDAMCNTQEEFVAWIDGDATLIGRIDELEADDSWDVGVTVRPPRKRKKSNYINAGVMFFKNCIESKLFLQDWIAAMGPPPLEAEKDPGAAYCDQVILEEQILMPSIRTPLWDIIGETHTIHGARVKLFDCTQYNNYWFHRGKDRMEYSPDTKILHFKGRHWAATKPTRWKGEVMHILDVYADMFLNE